jgi:hypothetical protein
MEKFRECKLLESRTVFAITEVNSPSPRETEGERDPSEKGEKRVERDPNIPPCRHHVADRARIEAVAP